MGLFDFLKSDISKAAMAVRKAIGPNIIVGFHLKVSYNDTKR